ncbi:MAG: glycoside hydrolase family 5 protein [Fibrobacteres bacterium]|nr:glycoside hydrolase family 5 protein [Fibrobacterota bacterium]
MRLLKVLSALVLAGSLAASAASIVERRGAIKTSGAKIVDQSGKQIQLTGMSLFWSIWGGEQFYNKATVDWLVRDWKVNAVRAAIAVEDNGGFLYPSNQRVQLKNLGAVVEAAVANGIYVIIDYHSHHALRNPDTAVKFFEIVAQKYGDIPNVIFEIYNEPSKDPQDNDYEWSQIKEYAEKVIPVIRKYSNNLVIVGTPKWSGDVRYPAADPLDRVKFPDVAYAYHFYACSHRTDFLLPSAIPKIPVFISEWGTTAANGGSNGLTCLDAAEKAAYKDTLRPNDKGQASATEWFSTVIDPNKLSSMNWSVVVKSEASAALAGMSGPEGGWDTLTGLSRSGKWVRNMIRQHCAKDSTTCPWLGDTLVPKVHEIPAAIPAVEYNSQMGTAKETDPAGGQILANVGSGDGIRYRVHVSSADSLAFRLRLQSVVSATISVSVDGVVVDSILVRPTGDRWAWFQGLSLPKVDTGIHEISLQFGTSVKSAFQISTLDVKKQGAKVQALPAMLDLSAFRKLTNVGLGSDNDSGPLFLHNFLTGSQAQYAIEVPSTDSFELQVVAVNLTGKPASVILKTTKNLLLNRNLDTLEIPTDGKSTLLKSKIAFATAGLQYIQFVGEGISDPGVYVAEVGIGKAVGIKAHSIRAGTVPSLRRIGSRIVLDLTGSTGTAKVQVVGADGRQILTQNVEAGALVGLDLPRTLRPQWVRVGGTANTVLSVPPGF